MQGTGITSKRHFCVGLTGGIGSGKSTVASLFERMGAEVIDADVIAHQLTMPGGQAINAIRTRFGEQAIGENGAMNRAFMRELVFQVPEARGELESLLHPMIQQVCMQQAAVSMKAYVIFVIPLLVERLIWRGMADRILVVDCPEALQVERVIKRDQMSVEMVRKIMEAQATRQERLNCADDVIENNRDEASLIEKVQALHNLYRHLSKTVTG